MRFVAAYLMATIGGNASPTKDDVRAILGAVGADVDEDKLGYLFDQVAGKDLSEILAARERDARLRRCRRRSGSRRHCRWWRRGSWCSFTDRLQRLQGHLPCQ
ncbi:hypothetical protein OsJ_23728 [Oryza sativa Japonica Group]|uniref:60S acidic ribosomal protein P2 n=1 Tax=Oryza sativa subsp. japonica TaxID=39947 RepID=A3BIA4_ORYSJ|nr:hypothetical protein OsJ_23728 [Oryza sativa Japonica Group]